MILMNANIEFIVEVKQSIAVYLRNYVQHLLGRLKMHKTSSVIPE